MPGPSSPLGVNVAYTRTAIVLALLFETLPFVVRTVQPVLHELDLEAEEAARSLGAPESRVFRSIVLPNILPGIWNRYVYYAYLAGTKIEQA